MANLVSARQLKIRDLDAADCTIISSAFTLQGWNKPVNQYQGYFQETLEGKRDVLVAITGGVFAGYVTIAWESSYPPFYQAGIPEIMDFNVLQKYQRQGIGSALMDEAERRIAARSAVAGIGVGLTPDYGPAQVLYARRGYVPDGGGATSNGQYLLFGSQVTVDDDLVLYLKKALTPG